MINKLIKEAKKEDIKLEVLTITKDITDIDVLNGKLKKFDIDKNKTYSLKALYNKRKIILDYNDISDIGSIIDNIKTFGSVIDNDNKDSLCENDFKAENKNIPKFDYKQIKLDMLDLDKYREKYKDIVNIYVGVEIVNAHTDIDNEKHHLEDGYVYIELYASISMSKNGVVKSNDASYYASEFNIDIIRNKVEKAINDLEMAFSATSIDTAKHKVLLTNEVVSNIMSSMSDMFFSKAIKMKVSILKDKVGKKVFSDKITILEEPVNDRFVVNKHFDKEGTLTYNKVIVDKGVFKIPLNNLEYAYKCEQKPTGNSGLINNLHIECGKSTYEELLKKLDNGIIIDRVLGLHAGINSITGDISLQAQGKLIKDSKVVKALNMIILSTNILELLNNVIEVGSDLEEFDMESSSPSLLLDNITISGDE